MHDCPECESPCDCDGEDHHQSAPDDCSHDCEEENYDDGFEGDDYEDDDY